MRGVGGVGMRVKVRGWEKERKEGRKGGWLVGKDRIEWDSRGIESTDGKWNFFLNFFFFGFFRNKCGCRVSWQ